jgi:hypothetical protein
MRAVQSVSLAMLASFALSADAGIVFSDDFDGPTTFWRARQNFDSIGVHPPDVGVDPWGGVGVLRDGSDAGYPMPGATGGTFYAEPYARMLGNLTPADGASTENQLVKFSFDFYVQSYATGGALSGLEFCPWDTAFVYSGGIRGTDMMLQADGTLKYYTNSGGFTQVPSFSVPTDTWASATLWINYANGAATLNIGAQSVNFTVADFGANRVDVLHVENLSASGKLSAIDNLNVEVVVPEPGFAALACLGVAGLMRRRK